jgi:hypothetical protein
MADSGAVNLKTKLEALERYTRPVANGETVVIGEWATLNSSGEFVKTTGPVRLAYLVWSGTVQPSARNVQKDPIFGDATETEISTGGVTVLRGIYRADVSNVGFDDGESYNQDDALMVTSGKLTPQTASNPTVAFVELAVGADNRLNFATV